MPILEKKSCISDAVGGSLDDFYFNIHAIEALVLSGHFAEAGMHGR